MLRGYILVFCRTVIFFVFVLAVIGKIWNITAFQNAVLSFQLLSPSWSKVASWSFLTTELIVVLLVIVGGNLLIIGFIIGIILLIIFIIALILALREDRKVRCNCFGLSKRYISSYDVVRNVLFILCSLVGIWTAINSFQSPSGIEVVLISIMAIYFVVLGTNLTDIVKTFQQPLDVS